MGICLNVGSGDLPAPDPWVNVDSNAGTGPNVVADIRSLPWEDGTVDRVFCGHTLEHLQPGEVVGALVEVRRVLAPGGGLCVVGPDYDRASLGDPDGGWVDDVLLRVIRDGGGRWSGDEHRWLSTESSALPLVRAVFPDATPVPIAHLPAVWPAAARVWWQFALLAAKEEE